MSKLKGKDSLHQEKVFKNISPRPRVQLEIIRELRAEIKAFTKEFEKFSPELAKKIIYYQDLVKENGEYYFLYQGSSNLKPLANYLAENDCSFKKIIKEFQDFLNLLPELDFIKKTFPNGINVSNFWIDQEQKIYLLPEFILEVKKNYSKLESKLPTAEYFRPPEIIAGQKWTKKAYLFNLTATFYYFLSGKCIFSDAETARVLNKIQNEKLPELKLLQPEIDKKTNSLFKEFLIKEPQKRPKIETASRKIEKVLLNKNTKLKLKSFNKKESQKSSAALKRKRKNEAKKIFLRYHWKKIIFIFILFTSLFWALNSGTPAAINKNTSAREVVNYFYAGFASKNIELMSETAAFDLGQMQNLISEAEIVEKLDSAFKEGKTQSKTGNSKPEKQVNSKTENSANSKLENPAAEKNSEVYSVENLEIEEKSSSDMNKKFKAFYRFNYQDSSGNYSIQAEDLLILEKIDGIWKITAVDGDFKAMTAGNYPWREE